VSIRVVLTCHEEKSTPFESQSMQVPYCPGDADVSATPPITGDLSQLQTLQWVKVHELSMVLEISISCNKIWEHKISSLASLFCPILFCLPLSGYLMLEEFVHGADIFTLAVGRFEGNPST
jgi:hypothetical protein